jgi:hypothetical protein
MRRLIVAAAFAACGLASTARADGPLKLEKIDEVVEQHDRLVQSCHRGAGRKNTLAVLMHFEIDPAGEVLWARPVDNNSAEAQCLARVTKKLHFPAAGVATRVAYPFMLMPQVRR